MLVKNVLHNLIDPNPDNARKQFDDGQLADLATSLQQGQRVPCIVFAKDGRFILVDGERRWRAAALAGLSELECTVLERAPSKGELLLAQLAIDSHNAHLSAMERAQLYAEAMRVNSLTAAQLHEREGISQGSITKYLSVFKCVQQVQQALAAGTIGMSDCYEISKAPQEQQVELLRLKLAGTSRDNLSSRVRGQHSSGLQNVRTPRIHCPLASGIGITVSGNALSLDDLIAALAEAQKEARKARDQGLDAKTFQAVMKDKAKAGGA